VYDPFGNLYGSHAVTNIAIKENWGFDWYGLSGDVSDTIKAVRSIGWKFR
jgi:hypothetical protein